MWIFDEDEKSSSPMFDYFLKRNLVKLKDGKKQIIDKLV